MLDSVIYTFLSNIILIIFTRPFLNNMTYGIQFSRMSIQHFFNKSFIFYNWGNYRQNIDLWLKTWKYFLLHITCYIFIRRGLKILWICVTIFLPFYYNTQCWTSVDLYIYCMFQLKTYRILWTTYLWIQFITFTYMYVNYLYFDLSFLLLAVTKLLPFFKTCTSFLFFVIPT